MDDMHHHVRAPKPGIRWLLLAVILSVVAVASYTAGQLAGTQSASTADSPAISHDELSDTSTRESISSTKALEVGVENFPYTLQMPKTWHAAVDIGEGLLPGDEQYATTLLVDPVAITLVGRGDYYEFSLAQLMSDERLERAGIEKRLDPETYFSDARAVPLDIPGTSRAVRIPPDPEEEHVFYSEILHRIVIEAADGMFYYGTAALDGDYPVEVQAMLDSISFG